MPVGDRYLRLYERLGAVAGYVVIVVACLPVSVPLAGIPHLVAVLVALHVAASLGARGGRAVARRRTLAVVITAPERLPRETLAAAAEQTDAQELVRALSRLPAAARDAWLDVAGDLPHRCGTTVRAEVQRQAAATDEAGQREVDGLAARLEWSTHRTALRILSLAPAAAWLVLTAIALADWPAPGESLLFGLATLFCVIGIVAMGARAVLDERRGYRASQRTAALVG